MSEGYKVEKINDRSTYRVTTQEGNRKTRKVRSLSAFINALSDSLTYIAMVGYLIIFLLSSIIGDFYGVSLFFTVFAVKLEIANRIAKDRETWIDFILFIISIFITIELMKVDFELKIGSVPQSSLLMILFIEKAIVCFRKS